MTVHILAELAEGDRTIDILLVEDNDADAVHVRRCLRNIRPWGIETVRVTSHNGALTHLVSRQPDLVILDYRLPDRNGLETLREINDRHEDLPVLMLTGMGSESIATTAMRRGAYDYLRKRELSPESLKKAILNVLRDYEEKLRNKEKIRELKQKARMDELTGLYNRRALEERLREELERVERYGTKLSFLLIDLDQFKRVNDRHGHRIGDRVLEKTGEVISDTVRDSDYTARYGGDEFCVIAPQTVVRDARDLAERLTEKIKNSLPGVLDDPIQLTCSIGITRPTSESPSPDRLIDRADRAMYVVKQNGGDGVEVRLDDSDEEEGRVRDD